MLRALGVSLLVLLVSEASAHSLPQPGLPQDLPMVEPVARSTVAGRMWELWRIPGDPVTGAMTAILRTTPLGSPHPSCLVTFTVGTDRPWPLRCSTTEPLTLFVSFISCGHLGPPNCVGATAGRDAVAIQENGETVVFLPALPPARGPLTIESTMTTCGATLTPCLTGDILHIFATARNHTDKPIEVDYLAYGFTPEGFEFLIALGVRHRGAGARGDGAADYGRVDNPVGGAHRLLVLRARGWCIPRADGALRRPDPIGLLRPTDERRRVLVEILHRRSLREVTVAVPTDLRVRFDHLRTVRAFPCVL